MNDLAHFLPTPMGKFPRRAGSMPYMRRGWTDSLTRYFYVTAETAFPRSYFPFRSS
jgi:hypothetical protein